MSKTHTFSLLHHTAHDLMQVERDSLVANINSVSISLQSFSHDHKQRQILGWPYLISRREVDDVVDRLVAELEILRKEAKKLLPER